MYLTLEQYLEMERKTKNLEKQIEALKKWIEDHKGICPFIESDINKQKEEEEEETMTIEESEYYIKKIEMYSDVFNYGRTRVEERKVAENL